MRTIGLGYDHGNSTTTAVVYMGDKEYTITFPSVTAPGNLTELVKGRKARGNDGIISPYQALGEDEYIIERNGAMTYVGNLAVGQGQGASAGFGVAKRYGSTRNLECLLTAAASLVPDTSFELLVVTGLPYRAFEDDVKKSVKQALNGMHHFRLNGRDRTVFVKVGKVLMEGAGASILQDKLLTNKEHLYGVIDIGGFSTDLYASRGLNPQTTLCGGVDAGIELAAQFFNTWFENSYGFPCSEENKHRVIAAFLAGSNYPSLRADDIVVSSSLVQQQIEMAFEKVGRKIVEFVAEKWKRGGQGKVASDFDTVQVIGGGAYYLVDSIKSIIKHASVPAEPELENAKGYAWYGSELIQRRATA